ncbi:MAG: hypothetical protein NC453_29450 [Muribaculum sp.]|nr:hypothetical protein [Muribaculum sp.]
MARVRKTIKLNFGNNVYCHETVKSIPIERGIYVASAGHFNGQYVVLRKKLYIGMADDTTIKDRICDHAIKQHNQWKRDYCLDGEDIYYQVAELNNGIRDVETAMIFTHKPPCNDNDEESYNGEKPAPNVITDIFLDVDGSIVDVQDLINRIDLGK